MNRKLFSLVYVFIAGNAMAQTPFSISVENIEALKPKSLSVASLLPSDKGARLISYASNQAAVAELITKITGAGATGVDLLEIHAYQACGKKIYRSEIQIPGNNDKLGKGFTLKPQDLINLSVDGQDFKCTLQAIAKSS